MNPAAPSISHRDGQTRTFSPAQMSRAWADVASAKGWKPRCQAKAIGNATCSFNLDNTPALDGGDGEAGRVSESRGENRWGIQDGVDCPADRFAGAPNRTARAAGPRVCQDEVREMVQKRITRDELYIADTVLFTGTAVKAAPIREADRPLIGAGRCGPTTPKIQTAFFDIVNERNSIYAHGLTRV